ncbi:hypothetical protein [Nocardioides panacisoli]|uniref:hypothetical protein n=1 Tax=Nocardioides panacisoli TaxID=627624 RepID=UPI0031D91356
MDATARVSAVYPLANEADAPLPSSGYLVFLFPRSAQTVLSKLTRHVGEGIAVFASHGLASVILVVTGGPDSETDADGAERTRIDDLLDLVDGDLCAAEIWPFEGETVLETQTTVRHWSPASAPATFEDVEASDLPYEVRTEVEQFNLNFQYFWARAYKYCDEYEDLAAWLQETVSDIARTVAAYARADTDPASLDNPQQHYGLVSLLVEINACLTMLNSQAVGVTPPLTQSSFPVGEYSLLGIGSAARAAWRIYRHMSDIFANAQHLDRLHAMRHGAPFDSGVVPYRFNPASWESSPLSIETQPPGADPSPPRRHIVYFSSRWGFHQTIQSVSLSWQCINGNAATDWNLLTLSHEFLHSHLRELLDELLLVQDDAELAALVEAYNSGEPTTWSIAAKQFLLQRLRWIDHGLQLIAARDTAEQNGQSHVEIVRSAPMTAEEAHHLLRDRLRFLEEVIVHVMDYIYFYDADDELFVSSLWHSWALVPNVQPKIDEYVLRTLLALASTWRSHDETQAFDDASARLDSCLASILDAGDHGLVGLARSVLDEGETNVSGSGRTDLRTRFGMAFPLVRWTKQFLISSELHAKLAHDELRVAGERAYPIDPWEFPDSRIESPTGFLLDRFRRMTRAYENDRLESDSLWQLLVLI